MRPDAMTVEPEMIAAAHDRVTDQGPKEVMADLEKREPALASFIETSLVGVAGKLSLSGTRTGAVMGSHGDVIYLIATVIEAVRAGHFEMWKDLMEGPEKTEDPPQDKDAPSPPSKESRAEHPAADRAGGESGNKRRRRRRRSRRRATKNLGNPGNRGEAP